MPLKHIPSANSLCADFRKLKMRPFLGSVLSYVRLEDAKLTLLWLVPAALLLLLVASGCYILDLPVSRFTRDPLAITEGHPLYGFVSNVGAILWSASAAFCFLAYVLLRPLERARDEVGFFITGGGISLILLVDDLFMLHDSIATVYLAIDEWLFLMIYAALCIYYLLRYWKLISGKGFLLFALAVAFFTLSIVVDSLPETLLPWHHLYEDGFKFLGITSWCGFQCTVCLHRVRLAFASRESIASAK